MMEWMPYISIGLCVMVLGLLWSDKNMSRKFKVGIAAMISLSMAATIAVLVF